MIYFDLIFMILSLSHDSDHEIEELTQIIFCVIF